MIFPMKRAGNAPLLKKSATCMDVNSILDVYTGDDKPEMTMP